MQTLKIMNTLKEYKNTYGQLINRDKSHFMLHSNAFTSTRDRIKRLTGFKQKQGPITYQAALYLSVGLGTFIFLILLTMWFAGLQVGKQNNLVMEEKHCSQRMYYRQYTFTYCLL